MENNPDDNTDCGVDGHGSPTNAAPELPLHREGSNIYVAVEKSGDLTVQQETSGISNGDLLKDVNTFAAKYRTETKKLEGISCSTRARRRFCRRSMARFISTLLHVLMGPPTAI